MVFDWEVAERGVLQIGDEPGSSVAGADGALGGGLDFDGVLPAAIRGEPVEADDGLGLIVDLNAKWGAFWAGCGWITRGPFGERDGFFGKSAGGFGGSEGGGGEGTE